MKKVFHQWLIRYHLEQYGTNLSDVGVRLLDQKDNAIVVMKTVQVNNNTFNVIAGDGVQVASLTAADEYQ